MPLFLKFCSVLILGKVYVKCTDPHKNKGPCQHIHSKINQYRIIQRIIKISHIYIFKLGPTMKCLHFSFILNSTSGKGKRAPHPLSRVSFLCPQGHGTEQKMGGIVISSECRNRKKVCLPAGPMRGGQEFRSGKT